MGSHLARASERAVASCIGAHQLLVRKSPRALLQIDQREAVLRGEGRGERVALFRRQRRVPALSHEHEAVHRAVVVHVVREGVVQDDTGIVSITDGTHGSDVVATDSATIHVDVDMNGDSDKNQAADSENNQERTSVNDQYEKIFDPSSATPALTNDQQNNDDDDSAESDLMFASIHLSVMTSMCISLTLLDVSHLLCRKYLGRYPTDLIMSDNYHHHR